MKAGKKPVGIKQKMREEKKRERRIGMAITAALLIAIVLVSGFIINSMLNPPPSGQNASFTAPLRAAIVDQLSLTFPNQSFVENATSTLERAGYTVDYYSGEKVSVGFYKDLPTYGYGIIILRVHSTISTWGVTLFTSQPYSRSSYVFEQEFDRVVAVAYSEEDAKKGIMYFGINPSFVESNMEGAFPSAVIVAMGCDGLNNTKMAEALVKRGAKAYVGWDGSVSSAHTDQATAHLLQHLITQKETIKNAVDDTMKEVGPDPADNSVLTYYPPSSASYFITNHNP
jgi:hypothetical protein